jgi:hypothetical protein
MEIISNFREDFIKIILLKVENLKKIGFSFIEYDKWKTKKIIKQKIICCLMNIVEI